LFIGGRVVGHHVCEREKADRLLSGELVEATGEFEWLGRGLYFWIDNPTRTRAWRDTRGCVNPVVLRGVIDIGFCLNLANGEGALELEEAYESYIERQAIAGRSLPTNKRLKYGVPLLRYLDCAVVETLHALRRGKGLRPYDSIICAFEEGRFVFNDGCLRDQTHLQLALRNRRYFRDAAKGFREISL